MDVYSIFVIFPIIILITAVFAWVAFFKARSTSKKLRNLEQKVNYLNSKIEDAVKPHEAERKQEDLQLAPEAAVNLPVPVEIISSAIVLGQEPALKRLDRRNLK